MIYIAPISLKNQVCLPHAISRASSLSLGRTLYTGTQGYETINLVAQNLVKR